jgi:CubicO group peptidase (beta-lactamase class C family)
MRRRSEVAVGVALAVVAGACSATPPPSPAVAPKPPLELAPEPTPAIEASVERGLLPAVRVQGEPVALAALSERMAAVKVPGLSIAVFDEQGVVWAKGYGVADVESRAPVGTSTLFQAGSISKSVNALAVLLAAADGRFSLDRPVNELLQTWQLPDTPLTESEPVTLRRLLSHTAGTTVHGFPGYPSGATLPTLLEVLDGRGPANTPPVRVDLLPGSQFRYSGGGTSVSQLVLMDTYRRPYPELMREHVLGPLGLSSSTYQQPLPPERLVLAAAGHREDGSLVPSRRHVYPEMAAAGLWTTATDLALFFREISLARAGRSSKIARNVALEMTTEIATSTALGGAAGAHPGLGVFLQTLDGAGLFGHDGVDEGFHARALASLDATHGLALMANSANGMRLFPEIERTVFATLGWPGAEPILVRVPSSETERAAWVGEYAGPDGVPISIRVAGERLTSVRPFKPADELVSVAPTRCVERARGLRYSLGGAGLELSTARGPAGTARRIAAGERLVLSELAAGREDEAIRAWRAQLGPDGRPTPETFGVYFRYGHELLHDGMTEGAVTIFRAASTVFPALPRAHASLGAAQAAAGRYPEALQAYETALERLAAATWLPPPEREELGRRFEAELLEARAKLQR